MPSLGPSRGFGCLLAFSVTQLIPNYSIRTAQYNISAHLECDSPVAVEQHQQTHLVGVDLQDLVLFPSSYHLLAGAARLIRLLLTDQLVVGCWPVEHSFHISSAQPRVEVDLPPVVLAEVEALELFPRLFHSRWD